MKINKHKTKVLRAPVSSLDDLRSQREAINNEIKTMRQSLMPVTDRTVDSASTGFKIAQYAMTAIGAAQVGLTGYRIYKNISGFISRFRRK